ncbi:MAG: HlyD family efflux transporter periplasmic adaptor subunit [Burkholderiales bacterium]|nr:HlyD family efflux transporter periplasmic adaptor subunit [Burkholderiales bacterium]
MRDPLLSPDWYRLANMRPRLRGGVRVSRQSVRGETWYVLSDPVTGRHHRFNDMAYSLVGSCNGHATLDEVWSARVAAEGDDAPSQAETIRIFAQAFAANLFVGDVAPDAAALVRANTRVEGKRWRASINPLAFRVPLWDPDRFLSEQVHRVAWLFSRRARVGIGAILLLGALLLAVNFGAVSNATLRDLGTGRMLLLLWLMYPLMKGLHELGHAFAVKVHGGDVHEVGVTLMLLTPLPYVDASASVGFAEKEQRIEVAAAGIVVEALLASFACVLWLLLEPGWLKDACFAVVFIGALSTLAVNGNPLLRFDGYHVLCDAAELPNLALRSIQYWQYQVKRRLLGVGGVRFGGRAKGERPWLIAYAPLAWGYRSALLILVAVVAANWSGALGLCMLALAAWSVLFKPAWAALCWVAKSPELSGRRPRAVLALLLILSVLGGLGVGVPLPQRTHAPGVVWLPDEALVRLATDGFVDQFAVQDGEVIEAGTTIAELSNEPLLVELVRVEALIERARVEHALRFEFEAQRAKAAEDELVHLDAERERLRERVAGLTVRAAIGGRVVIDPRRIVAGQFVPQGELIAQVLADDAPLVRTLVRNEDIALVRERPGVISVELAHADAGALHAVLDSAVPKATASLPTPALGDAAGGSITLDTSDKSGRTAREPFFQLDLKLDAGTRAHVGARALVTFAHGDASAAEITGRFLRQSFLRYFER